MDKNKPNDYKYLNNIRSPEDVKSINSKEMEALCAEIRDCIIETSLKNGGHLASNLGVVELSVAIHRVFDCPRDHIIFDVGHQSYAHKLLTGRYEQFGTLRQTGGLSGFTNRAESEYDCFGAGHSSTSLSAALGFAEADKLSGNDAYTVVVLGDGAFTGGMIHEALNNCNKQLSRLIIVLNENEMSISKNIGRFANSLANLRKKSGYLKAKRFTISFIKKIPLVGKGIFRLIRAIKKSVKNALYGSNYFEDMGLYYLGPIDGNDYESVESLLVAAKNAGENVLVHIKTQKGKGYDLAEQNPNHYHGIQPIDKEISPTSYSHEFGKAICEMGADDDRICAITAAMSSGTGLDDFAKTYKDRFFDVGIAEEHAVTFAAGLAANGYKPVFAVYSTFLQRSYDQMIHDVALQNLPVTFCIDRAGFNNADGATHHGIFDVAFMSQINGLKIYTPATYDVLVRSLHEAVNSNSPCAIRYPSGSEEAIIRDTFYNGESAGSIGTRCDFDGEVDVLIVTHGRIAKECIKAKKMLLEKGICAGIVLCEFVSPYDKLSELVGEVSMRAKPSAILFVEEEIKAGGFGMLLSEQMRKRGMLEDIKYDIIGAENAFVKCNAGQTYIEASNLDGESIAEMAFGLAGTYKELKI